MIDIKVRKNFDIGKMVRAIPKETAILLNDIADAAVVDIREGVEKEVDLDGKAFTKLKVPTVKAKKKKRYQWPSKPLVASNKMVGIGRKGARRGIYVKTRATINKLLAIVTTALSSPWGYYHHTGADPQPERKWFGISKRMPRKVDRLIKSAETRIVNSADTGGMK